MSYCRWSSDSFRCDLYCYEDVSGGWTTHVAGRKPIGDIPVEPDLMTVEPAVWFEGHQKLMKWLETAEYANLELAHAGETFNDPTLEEFRDRLLYLRSLGYRFPDYVLEAVNQEIADGKETASN